MNKVEFIKMMRQDIETHADKEMLENVVCAYENCLAAVSDVDIDTKETPETLLEKIYKNATVCKGGNKGKYFGPSEKNVKLMLSWIGVDCNELNVSTDKPKTSKLDIDIDDML